ncbi:MAG: hypothetical protein SPL13_04275 [Clostridia bacterium]|nr:hypothetical protein [Clostridia bacterium]
MTVIEYLKRYDKEPYYDALADVEAEKRAIDEQTSKEIEEYEKNIKKGE